MIKEIFSLAKFVLNALEFLSNVRTGFLPRANRYFAPLLSNGCSWIVCVAGSVAKLFHSTKYCNNKQSSVERPRHFDSVAHISSFWAFAIFS